MRVLLVEDHAKLALTVAAGLRRLGMAVDVAFDGDEALAKTAITDYDVATRSAAGWWPRSATAES
jgi:DNA-binding response OmpR family regulator